MFLFLVSFCVLVFCVYFQFIQLRLVENDGYPFYAVKYLNLTIFVLLIALYVFSAEMFLFLDQSLLVENT